MTGFRALAFAAAVFSCGPAFAAASAGSCPVSDAAAAKAGSYAQGVLEAIDAAPDCDRAFTILDACQLGSSADNGLSDPVVEKCEALFLDRAKVATKKAYTKAKARCDAIAANNSGTLYQSFAAVCRARVARDFADKHRDGK